MGSILIEGIKLYAYHGCLPEEAKIGGHYTVDVWIEANLEQACKTDELHETIDYVIIYNLVKKEMAQRSKLIEHVGKRILNGIIDVFPTITFVQVKVIKLSPPMNGNVEMVSVVLQHGVKPT
jgi:dihydroneopterin aldolase